MFCYSQYSFQLGYSLFLWSSYSSVSNDQLMGDSALAKAQVQQWIHFVDSDVLPAACTWVFPCLGIMQYNKQVCSSYSAEIINLNTSASPLEFVFCSVKFYQVSLQNTERAKEEIKKAMSLLDNHLSTRTFLVGERVTLADITVACTTLSLYKMVSTADLFRELLFNLFSTRVVGQIMSSCKLARQGFLDA